MLHRIDLTWREETFESKKRWVCDLNGIFYFTYYFTVGVNGANYEDESKGKKNLGGQYKANVWFRFDDKNLGIGDATFPDIHRGMERWFIQTATRFITVNKQAENDILKTIQLSIGIVFNKDGKAWFKEEGRDGLV